MDMQALLFIKLNERWTFSSDPAAEDRFYETVCDLPWLIRAAWMAVVAVMAWVRVIVNRCRQTAKPPLKQKVTSG